MSTIHDELIPINSWDEIPAFASEDEEADFWGTHCLGPALSQQLGTFYDMELPSPRKAKS